MKRVEDLTAQCIRCGFCLEDCPTFTETGSELESPRGRIYLVRSAMEGKLRWQEDVKQHLDRCLGCRACETACPSGVQYGAILEIARDKIQQEKPSTLKKGFLKGTTSPAILRTQLNLARLLPGKRVPAPLSKLLSGEAAEADLPTLPASVSGDALAGMDEKSLPAVKGEVYLLEGCAMRVLYPHVHRATRRLLRRVGYVVREVPQGCCGALHAHNGYLDEARKMGNGLVQTFSGDLPVVVNSAGCGSTMKEYGHLLESEAGAAFARRTFDLSEFLLQNGLLDELAKSKGLSQKITYHDACHLSHGQKITEAPRTLLKAIPNAEYVELPESLTCCGSAGIYNVVQPKLARRLLNRKWKHVQSTQATVVAMGNPGCHGWIAQASRETGGRIEVVHTAELLERAFGN